MDFTPSILSAGRAVAYKINSLTERYLQETGATPLSTFALHSFVIIPATIWALLFVRPDDIAPILSNSHQIAYFLIIFLLWPVQQFIHSYRVNSTSTVSILSNLKRVVDLPLLLAVGVLFNQDAPNFFSLAAIVVLTAALLIKPAHHQKNVRPRFSTSFMAIAGLLLVEAVVDTILLALSRQLLKEIPPDIFIGVFDILIIVACILSVGFLARRQPTELKTLVKKHPIRATSIPVIFFAGSVVEFYAHAALPIYVVLSIGCITFIMDVFSDLWRQRIQFNLQTASFIGLVMTGISLAVYSI